MKKEYTNYYSILLTFIIVIILVLLYCTLLKNIIVIPECPIHKYIHIYCPVCGCTRATISLLHLQIIKSLKYNPIIIYTLLSTLLYLLLYKKLSNLKWKYLVYIGLTLLISFFIIRNILFFMGIYNIG